MVTIPHPVRPEAGPHDQHTLTRLHLVAQEGGVPYEVEQVRCIECEEVVEEAKRRLNA